MGRNAQLAGQRGGGLRAADPDCSFALTRGKRTADDARMVEQGGWLDGTRERRRHQRDRTEDSSGRVDPWNPLHPNGARAPVFTQQLDLVGRRLSGKAQRAVFLEDGQAGGGNDLG